MAYLRIPNANFQNASGNIAHMRFCAFFQAFCYLSSAAAAEGLGTAWINLIEYLTPRESPISQNRQQISEQLIVREITYFIPYPIDTNQL
jgi:hypothetical protein